MMSSFVAASFASVSAISFPWIPAWAPTRQNWIFLFISPISTTFLLIFSIRYVWMLLFLRESSVIRLSVYMVAVLSSVSMFAVNSSALRIASCSAWLLVHLLFNLFFRLLMTWPNLNMTIPAPTPCSDLLHQWIFELYLSPRCLNTKSFSVLKRTLQTTEK